MASIKSIFEIPTRPCWVDGRRAIFHRWTDSARPVKARGVEENEETPRYQLHSVHALVEYEDGTMERVWPNAVQFADSMALFAEFDWEGMECARDFVTWCQEGEDAPESETPRSCMTCGYKYPYESQCVNVDYTCRECDTADCKCKQCHNFDQWEPKGGTA